MRLVCKGCKDHMKYFVKNLIKIELYVLLENWFVLDYFVKNLIKIELYVLCGGDLPVLMHLILACSKFFFSFFTILCVSSERNDLA